jgi:hypothetical protein
MMTIFLNASGAYGFTKSSIAHPLNANDDDEPGGATPIAIAVPALDDESIFACPNSRIVRDSRGSCPGRGTLRSNAVQPSGRLAPIPHIRRGTPVSPSRTV